jgi:radical SAM protein with 4Fe4S-binding SPASM domain
VSEVLDTNIRSIKLKRDQLKPFVFEVEGAANFALYNMMTGAFYRFSLKGDVEELREELLKEDLIFETGGVVPEKIVKLDLMDLKNRLFLRELQIRLNGKGEDNCWNRIKNKGETRFMSYPTLNRLKEMCKYIPIEKIRIEAEVYEKDRIEMVLGEFKFSSIEFFVESGIDTEQTEFLKNRHQDAAILFIEEGKKRIKDQKIELHPFLYSQYFNPCLGHHAAVDANGDIKCCLWSDHILGNIETDDLKKLIIRGDFDLYWEAHKMKIESCKDCELRFVCHDCRVDVLKKGAEFYAKTFFCEYDPYKGV